MLVGAMGSAGRQVFALVRRLREELGVNTTCGASNVSFGLPNRNGLNGAFLTMAIANGMTSAITSPLHEEVRQAVMAADVMMGHDRDCAAWIARYREGGGSETGGRSGRRGGRAARVASRGPAAEDLAVGPPSDGVPPS
jgi:5-methyltetrahydrofolate--homocysteine methyltransferase